LRTPSSVTYGEAPITEENLSLFHSDLKTIIFDSPKFKL